MRSVIQRVSHASVRVDGDTVGAIGKGLLVLLAAGIKDSERDIDWMVEKVAGLRIFEDDDGKMNRSIVDICGEVLVVSQFTLYGDCRRGKRPSFGTAMPPSEAKNSMATFVRKLGHLVTKVETGRFGAMMEVELLNSGPVTILLDSEKTF